MTFVTYITASTIVLHVLVYGQMYDDALSLRSDILKEYDKTVRPLLNQADLMHVNITYDIVQIPEIDEVKGTMTVLIQLNYVWIDERIRWNPYQYNNTDVLVLSADSVWKPRLVLISSADPELSLDSSMNTVRYYPDGTAFWYPTSVISVSCVINIEIYPFDTQECPIPFMVMDYFSEELELHAVNREASLKYYIKNGIWELVKTESHAFEDELPMYSVYLYVNRKPTFIVIIVIVPIMLLSLMSIMVFLLPPESGERMSYSVTLLLALMVFLTIVSDNIPKTLSPLSILSYFIGLNVLLSAFITLVTILNLRLYYKDDQEPVPSWLCYCCRKHETDQQYTTRRYEEQFNRPNATQLQDPAFANKIALRANPSVSSLRHGGAYRVNSHGGDVDAYNLQFHKTFDDDRSRLSAAQTKTRPSWKDISRIADWVMFTVSIVYFVVVFIVFALVTVFKD